MHDERFRSSCFGVAQTNANAVYNITDYIQDHPGGAEALIEVAGQDATTEYEDVGHSEDAQEIMNPYLVGVLKDAAAFVPAKTVRVVRRNGPAEVKQVSSGSAVQKVGYSVLGLGTAGLTYLAFSGNLQQLTVLRPDHGRFQGLFSKDHAFVQGFALASIVSGVIGVSIIRRVQAAASISAGFTRYPPHKPSKARVHEARMPAGFLAPKVYKKLPLVEREQLSPSAVRLVFALPTPTTVLGLPIGQHVAIKAVLENGTVVSRSYTPTSNNADLGRLELVVRIYDDGLLTGRYLSKLNMGDEVEFRGPKGAMRYKAGKGVAKKVGMIAGGTGITPMYQLIRAICEDDTDLTEVSLIYANRSEEDILLRKELDRFARLYPKNFRVWYMLDTPPAEGWTGGQGFVTKELMKERLPGPSAEEGEVKVLLCGPPGMVNASKKGLVELGFEAPGAVSKMTDQIFCF